MMNVVEMLISKGYDVAFDMDGVQADWCGSFDAKYGFGASSQFDLLSLEEKNKVKEELSNGDFYENIEPMEKGCMMTIELVRRGCNVMILTSVGKQNPENVVRQKKNWIAKTFPRDVAEVLLNNFFFTMSSEDKANFARPNLCLIDDRLKSRAPFIAAGGIAMNITDV